MSKTGSRSKRAARPRGTSITGVVLLQIDVGAASEPLRGDRHRRSGVEDADVHFDLIGKPDRDGGSENRGPVSERALGEVPVRIDPR